VNNISPARATAFEILRRVTDGDAYASNLLASDRYSKLSREDHALAQELVLGVLRWQAQLDFLIEHYARRPLKKLDGEVVIALRLGLYQLRFLSRVPPHAAINESVNLAKERKKESAAPLVNAVLRSAQRDSRFDLSKTIKDSLERLVAETSHPAWLLKRWIARYGEAEARDLALANNTAPRTALRFNARRHSVEQTRLWLKERKIEVHDSTLTPKAFNVRGTIKGGSLPPQSEPIRNGWIYLQDEASQLIARLAAQSVRENAASKVWDSCAAPGSKTSLMASLLREDSLIVASDLYDHRLRTMKELNARLAVDQIRLVQLDATRELPFEPESFDLVLLDAPCTGLGTLQRHPEIKWRLTEAKIGELAELQKRLLANAAQQVRPGGLLVYSVCSTEPEEGEDIISWFRNEHAEFRDMTRERLTELGIEPWPLLTPSFGARTFTHGHGTESFFFCVLWKRRGTN
jgi:16S rRNA (cytosine967-C5)-methyltransferase